MCMYVCIYIYIYIHIHICIHTHIYIYSGPAVQDKRGAGPAKYCFVSAIVNAKA